MSLSQDPLLTLRQAIKNRDKISFSNADGPCASLLQATNLVFSPTCSFPKSTQTRYKKQGVGANPGPQDLFTLEAVYLAWLLRDAHGAEYMKQARENGLGVGFVSVTERKSLVEWLEGKSSSNEHVVPLPESATPPGSPPRPTTALPSSSSHRAPAGDHTTSPTKRRYVADAHDVEIVKKIRQNEIELRDRTTVLRGEKPNNFSAIRLVFTEKLKKAKEVSKSGFSAAATVPTPDAKLQARKARQNYPIIMISSSPTALITMHNVKRFLQESVFEPSQEARARATAEGNMRPEDMIPIYRKRTTIDSSGKETESQARYYVVDSTEALAKFGADAWDRVVCVMTTGQAWQFRPYKWNEPRQLFHHVKGIYVAWSNDPANPKIKDWNVTELKIDPLRRHVDKSVVAHFWKTLDAWVLANKPWLMKA